MRRREFLSGAAAAGVLGSLAVNGVAQNPGPDAGKLPYASAKGTMKGEMLYRELGKTGEQVSLIGLGGSHLAKGAIPEAESIRLIHAAIDRGITFMDNSWDYNNGQSEMRMGKALAQAGYRNKVFLMTKLDGRSKQIAHDQINDSLTRLKTDHIDLIQHHEILRFDDPDRVFAEGGAMEAVLAAKQAGKVRHIGFTGHKDPRVHLYMLEVANKNGFHFDTVQMPLNVMDAHFRSFAQMVVPEAVKQGIGVLGMKSLGDGVILKSGTVSAIECIHYALNLPVSVLICGIDKQEVLDQAFAAAKSFELMDEQRVEAILRKTREAAMTGKYELFKTTSHFDTTAKHPDWLGGDTPAVEKLAPTQAG